VGRKGNRTLQFAGLACGCDVISDPQALQLLADAGEVCGIAFAVCDSWVDDGLLRLVLVATHRMVRGGWRTAHGERSSRGLKIS